MRTSSYILVSLMLLLPALALHAVHLNSTQPPASNSGSPSHPNSIAPIATPASTTPHTPTAAPSSANSTSTSTIPGRILPNPEPTRSLPNPELDLTAEGRTCLQKCKDLQGVSCKKWSGNSITCCQFTGCQWPFYCDPDKRIMVEGCTNKP